MTEVRTRVAISFHRTMFKCDGACWQLLKGGSRFHWFQGSCAGCRGHPLQQLLLLTPQLPKHLNQPSLRGPSIIDPLLYKCTLQKTVTRKNVCISKRYCYMIVKTTAIIPALAKISFSLLVSPSHSRPGSSGIPLNTEDR